MFNEEYAFLERLIAIRRKLHQHPELSFQEVQTTKEIIHYLEQIDGIHLETGKERIGLNTGVVATLTRGKGRTIAIRADIDALPITEGNDHAYRSRNQGKMHACGHDGHTTIAIGAAQLLAEAFKKEQLQGTVKLIFQPAEEMEDEDGLTGSPYMISSGVLNGVDAVIALHLDPEHQLGEILLHPGASMANVDTFTATIKGTGGHAAYPEQGADPLWMLSSILPAIYSLSARKVSALDPAVISIGQIEGGTVSNIIPDKVTVKGTVRTYKDDTRDLLAKEVENIFATVRNFGGNYQFKYNRGEPALVNDRRVCSWIEETIQNHYPNYTIFNRVYGLGGEDFGYMTRQIPGAMFFLGAGLGDSKDRSLHMPHFDFDEAALRVGAKILAETAKGYLKGKYSI